MRWLFAVRRAAHSSPHVAYKCWFSKATNDHKLTMFSPPLFSSFSHVSSISIAVNHFWCWSATVDAIALPSYHLKYPTDVLQSRAEPHHLDSFSGGHGRPPRFAALITFRWRCMSPIPHSLLQSLQPDQWLTRQSRFVGRWWCCCWCRRGFLRCFGVAKLGLLLLVVVLLLLLLFMITWLEAVATPYRWAMWSMMALLLFFGITYFVDGSKDDVADESSSMLNAVRFGLCEGK